MLVGLAALAAALGATIVAPPTLLVAPLGAAAVAGLSRDRRLGVLGAALLVVLAVPFGRAADTGLPTLVGIPVRLHDATIATAVLLLAPTLRRRPIRPAVARIAVGWLVLGAAALVVGVVAGQALRDILRDVRWWSLYALIPLALVAGSARPQLLRGLLWGSTLYALLLIVAAFLPAFEGALKDRALEYDAGLLRLQFNGSPFVIASTVFVVHRLLRRPSIGGGLWLAVLVAATLLSVTRVSVVVLAGAVAASLLIATIAGIRRGGLRRALVVAGALAIAVAVAVGGLLLASSPGRQDGLSLSPIERLLLQGPYSSLDDVLRGRATTYAAAVAGIAERPVTGHGLGALVAAGAAPPGSRPATPGMQPGVDNAYLTVALKAGIPGAVVFAALVVAPLLHLARRRGDRHRRWFSLAWLALLALTLTQSFATTTYGPFAVALLAACSVPAGGRRTSDRRDRRPVSAPYGAASPGSSGA